MRVFLLSAYPTVRAGLAAVLRERDGVLVVGAMSPDALISTRSAEKSILRLGSSSMPFQAVRMASLPLKAGAPGMMRTASSA